MTNLQDVLDEIALDAAAADDRGEVAQYIPELAKVDRAQFGIAVALPDGRVLSAGNAATGFSIQSVSKVFTLALALGKLGDAVWSSVGREPSGNPFNSIVQLEQEKGRPRNPFINAGAIAVVDLIMAGHQPKEAIGEIIQFIRHLADDDSILIDEQVARSETAHGDRNASLAHFMRSFGNIDHPVDHVLGVYFHQCAIVMNCQQLARAGLFLASQGVRATGAADQCHHADVRALRRIGRICLPRRPAGQERRRRRYPGNCAGKSLDCSLVAGP